MQRQQSIPYELGLWAGWSSIACLYGTCQCSQSMCSHQGLLCCFCWSSCLRSPLIIICMQSSCLQGVYAVHSGAGSLQHTWTGLSALELVPLDFVQSYFCSKCTAAPAGFGSIVTSADLMSLSKRTCRPDQCHQTHQQ